MAESVVSFLLGKLGSFLEEEAKSLRGVEAKARWIKDELERINAFLRVADETAETNPQLKVWVKQVRDVAYDIEDALDLFKLRVAQNQGDGFCGFILKLPSCINNIKYRHQLASSIQGIESKVKDVSEGQKRYDSMILKRNSEQSSTATRDIWQDYRTAALWVKEAELVGIDMNRKQLIQWLVEDNNSEFQVISVVGMGGLGKTTLAKKAYDADRVKNHFQCHAWVNVSQSFTFEVLLREIIRQLFNECNQSAPEKLEEMSNFELKKTINSFLQQRSYVIVLDDVWKIEHSDAITNAFPRNNFGNRVMLTTRLEDVAQGASRESKGKVFHLEPLSLKDSTTLFCRKTFQEDICPDDLKDIVEHILKRCNGLPLAIVAISAVLATKSRNEWEMVKDSLDDELEGSYMSKILSLSYYDLPYSLKSCFLYLGAFPEDYVIKCKRLARLWVAEGFVKPKGGKTLEEVAMSYLTQLVNRSLIQVVRTDICDGRARECRIHDLIRDLIRRVSKEQNFMTVVAGTSTAWPEKTRRLSVLKTMEDDKEIKGIWQLRSLLVIQSYLLIPKDVKLLRVLDLERSGLAVVPNNMFNQYHLRYLSLRGHFELWAIPNSIGRLVNLEVLDLRETRVRSLPTTILKLQRLRHLLVGYRRLRNMYPGTAIGATLGIGCWHALQTLYFVDLRKEGMVEELGKLKQLRKLGITNLRKGGSAFCSLIENLDQLRNLSVRSEDYEKEILDLKYLSSPPKYLERLYLEGHLDIVPQGLSSLPNLMKLSLRSTQLQEDQFICLQSLPYLLSLYLGSEAYVGDTLCFKVASLKKLRFLFLEWLSTLRRVIIEESAMSSLEELHIDYCMQLEKVPFGIEKLSNLKSLTMLYPSNILLNSIDCTKGGEDYYKVQSIPTISILMSTEGWINLPRERE